MARSVRDLEKLHAILAFVRKAVAPFLGFHVLGATMARHGIQFVIERWSAKSPRGRSSCCCCSWLEHTGLFRDVEGARMSTNPSRVLSTTQLHTKVLMSKIQTQRAEAIAAAASDEDGEGFRIGTRTIKQKTLASWLKPLVNTSSVCHLQWSSCSSVWNMYVWTDVCRD